MPTMTTLAFQKLDCYCKSFAGIYWILVGNSLTLKYVKTNSLRSLSCVMCGMAGWNYTL